MSNFLRIEAFAKIPSTEYRRLDDGTVEFRYVTEGYDYPGFDDRWRKVSDEERRQTIRIGGRVADWLMELEQG